MARVLLAPILLAGIAWASAALWFYGPASRPLAAALAGGFFLASLAILVAVRPARRAVLAIVAGIALVVFWWRQIPPSNDRDWLPDVARTAHADFDGSRVTVKSAAGAKFTLTISSPNFTRVADSAHRTLQYAVTEKAPAALAETTNQRQVVTAPATLRSRSAR